MEVESEVAGATGARRPRLVWTILILYGCSAAWNLLIAVREDAQEREAGASGQKMAQKSRFFMRLLFIQ